MAARVALCLLDLAGQVLARVGKDVQYKGAEQ